MDDGVRDRVRVQLSRDAVGCPRCERQELRLMRSRDARSGLAKVNPFWDAHEKVYERCKVCGFRRAVTGSAAEAPVEAPGAKRPVVVALGWSAVVLMVVLIAVLTVVLAGLLLVVSVWLAVAVPLVVLLLVVGVVAWSRRG